MRPSPRQVRRSPTLLGHAPKGVEGTSVGLFGVAAAGGTPVFERGCHQLVPVASAGYNSTSVRGCFREICRAVQLRTFDWV